MSNPETPAVPRAPKAFIFLLGAYLLLNGGSALYRRDVLGAVFLVIVAIAAWRTVQGGKAASFYLSALLVLGIVGSVRAAASMWTLDPTGALVSAAFAVYLSVLVGYIFLHPGMRALYTKAERAKWTER